MKRPLAALLLAGATLLTAGCGDDGPPDSSGDSNPPNQQTQEPAPTATE